MGNKGWNVDELAKRIKQHRENGRRLFWLEGAVDVDVQCILKGARALIQSSISEGFGLPVVEAGSQGVPLLLSDIPVFHEIAGEDATYFPVGKSEASASAIGHLLRSKESKRPTWIKAMTWRESSAKLARMLLPDGARRESAESATAVRSPDPEQSISKPVPGPIPRVREASEG